MIDRFTRIVAQPHNRNHPPTHQGPPDRNDRPAFDQWVRDQINAGKSSLAIAADLAAQEG